MSQKLSESVVFNEPTTFVRGWYWAVPSSELGRKPVGVNILGKELVLFRGTSGRVHAMDAYCPHMGAHFKEGKIEGEGIRCGFHNWKFSGDGHCDEIPCQKHANLTAAIPPVATYPVEEKFGLVWVHTSAIGADGTSPEALSDPLPSFAEIGPEEEIEVFVGPRTHRPCRPEVVMLNAIDAQHFNSVHPGASKLAGQMDLAAKRIHPRAIRLENQTAVPLTHWIGRLLAPLYRKNRMTYFLDYWYSSSATVTLGPDFLHFYLLFPHRPTMEGGTEGIMAFVARRPKLPFGLGKWVARGIAYFTYIVGSYFEKGDRLIFESIRFSMKAPVKADHAIIEFIRHTEEQATAKLPWGGIDSDHSRSPKKARPA